MREQARSGKHGRRGPEEEIRRTLAARADPDTHYEHRATGCPRHKWACFNAKLIMELKQLRALVALADELNFTRAATRVHIAQPAFSRQIKRLEDELGAPLVDRTSRRVQMTPAGADLVQRARRILADVEEARAAVDASRSLVRGRLTIGTTQSPGPLDLAMLLAEYRQLHPGVELLLREELSQVITERLRADEIDVGFITAVPEVLRRDLRLVPIANEPLVLIVAPTHPLAPMKTISLRQLTRDPFVLFPAGATIRDSLLKGAAAAGVSIEIAFESSDPARIRGIVATGLALGILPRSDVLRPGPQVVPIEILETPLTHQVFLARRERRRLSAAAVAFENFMATRQPTGQPALSGPDGRRLGGRTSPLVRQ